MSRITEFTRGYNKRSEETVLNGPGPWTYWRWGEWATYIGCTIPVILAGCLAFWLLGVFIRWEVGPVAGAAVYIPYCSYSGSVQSSTDTTTSAGGGGTIGINCKESHP